MTTTTVSETTVSMREQYLAAHRAQNEEQVLYPADHEALAEGAAKLGVSVTDLSDEQVRDIVFEGRDRRSDIVHRCAEHEGCEVDTWREDDDLEAPDNKWHHILVGATADWYRVEVEKPGPGGWDVDVYIPESGPRTASDIQDLAAVLTIAAARVTELIARSS